MLVTRLASAVAMALLEAGAGETSVVLERGAGFGGAKLKFPNAGVGG